jgi:hypothetical protein
MFTPLMPEPSDREQRNEGCRAASRRSLRRAGGVTAIGTGAAGPSAVGGRLH